jgi:hypothetical protein
MLWLGAATLCNSGGTRAAPPEHLSGQGGPPGAPLLKRPVRTQFEQDARYDRGEDAGCPFRRALGVPGWCQGGAHLEPRISSSHAGRDGGQPCVQAMGRETPM